METKGQALWGPFFPPSPCDLVNQAFDQTGLVVSVVSNALK